MATDLGRWRWRVVSRLVSYVVFMVVGLGLLVWGSFLIWFPLGLVVSGWVLLGLAWAFRRLALERYAEAVYSWPSELGIKPEGNGGFELVREGLDEVDVAIEDLLKGSKNGG